MEFDTGLDHSTYEAYKAMEGESGGDGLIDDGDVDSDGDGGRSYLDFTNTGEWTSAKIQFGETCVETFVKTDDDWGEIDGLENGYDCMGTCGPGCLGFGRGRDCLKHDVCSFFKSYALKEDANGFCKDIDCGDEAAQSVINCWIRNQFILDEPVICNRTVDEENPNIPQRVSSGKRRPAHFEQCGREIRACLGKGTQMVLCVLLPMTVHRDAVTCTPIAALPIMYAYRV